MLWASRPKTNKHLNKKLYNSVAGKPRVWNSRCVDPLKGIQGVQTSDVTYPHTLEICHWLLKRGITLCWIIGKIHYSERRAADRATSDASLQISSNFYFKFWTSIPPSLYRFSWNAKWTGGKKSHGARPVVQPWRASCHPSRRQEGDVTLLELGHTQSGSRPLSALNLPFHISLHNLCPSVCQWTVRGA